jgi:hypothetical protein
MTVRAIAAICALLAAALVGIGTLSNRIRAQETAIATLQEQKEKLQRLNGENQSDRSVVIDPNEMDRLRRETSLLLKLRNEIGMYQRSSSEPAELPAAKAELVARLLDEREQLAAEEKQIQQLSERAACLKTLEAIAVAKAGWAAHNAAEKGLPVMMENLVDYLPGRVIPVCPAAGHYSVNRIGAAPVCSIEGHSIPEPVAAEARESKPQ